MISEEPDYSAYSLSELYDARRSIDRARFPRRAEKLDGEIRVREHSQSSKATQVTTPSPSGPRWTTVVGVLGIIFGISGLWNNSKEVLLPWTLDAQGPVLAKFEEYVEEDRDTLHPRYLEFWEANKRIWQSPAWYKTLTVILGVAGIAAMSAYIFGAIFILLRKRLGVSVFLWACGASVVLGLVDLAVGFFALSLPALILLTGSIAGVAIDTTLGVVVLVARGSARTPGAKPDESAIE